MNKLMSGIALSLLALSAPARADESESQPLTLTLERLSLDNIDDAAGRWQHDGGKVYCPNGTHIANYAAHRRVTFSGTSPQNTAMVTMTLFFLGDLPPQNITLQGSHDFQSGGFVGSVSAASDAFGRVRDASFIGIADAGGGAADGAVTIDRLGKSSVNPCD